MTLREVTRVGALPAIAHCWRGGRIRPDLRTARHAVRVQLHSRSMAVLSKDQAMPLAESPPTKAPGLRAQNYEACNPPPGGHTQRSRWELNGHTKQVQLAPKLNNPTWPARTSRTHDQRAPLLHVGTHKHSRGGPGRRRERESGTPSTSEPQCIQLMRTLSSRLVQSQHQHTSILRPTCPTHQKATA